MASLDDGPTTGTTGAADAADATCMGATVDVGADLPADTAGAAGPGTATVIASTGAGSAGASGATGTSTATAAMVETTNAGTNHTTGTASQECPDKTQASISLPSPKDNPAKEIYKTPTHEHIRLAAQLCAFLIQDSLDLIQFNDYEKIQSWG